MRDSYGRVIVASLSQAKDRNGFRLSFYDSDQKKRVIWLGGYRKREAEEVKRHVERLLVAKASGSCIEKRTAEWLGDVGSKLRCRLVELGLADPTKEANGPATLGPFIDEFIAGQSDVKSSTMATYRQAYRSLIDYFGEDCRLDSITVRDAKRWRKWQKSSGNQRGEKESLSENTVRRRTGLARQIFADAVDGKLIETNPFFDRKKLPATVRGNPARQEFVPSETIQTVLESIQCPELRAIVALARYGGLRVPSEPMALRWSDIDFVTGAIKIRAPKTEHHSNSGIRACPLFPELRPHLQLLHDIANPGVDCPMSSRIISRYRSNQNLRTPFLKLLKRLDIPAWPRLFQNLRATRETELIAAGYPRKDVNTWLGHTGEVSLEFYEMTMQASFQKACHVASDSERCSTRGSIRPDNELHSEPEADDSKQKPPENTASEGSRELLIAESVGDTGFELYPRSRRSTNELRRIRNRRVWNRCENRCGRRRRLQTRSHH